jgi:hypothetical protein
MRRTTASTGEWVWWWNNQRLHGELDMRTPPRSKTRTTLTKNQANRHLPDKAPDRNESQADSRTVDSYGPLFTVTEKTGISETPRLSA